MSRPFVLLPLLLAASLIVAFGFRQGETLSGSYGGLSVMIMFKETKFQLVGFGLAARGSYSLNGDTLALSIQEWISAGDRATGIKEMSGKVSKDRKTIDFGGNDPLTKHSEKARDWTPDDGWTATWQARLKDEPENYFSPEFSPDGAKLLYSVKTKFHQSYLELFDLKNGKAELLKGRAKDAWFPTFVPRSSRILANVDGDIVTMNLDGSGVKVLIRIGDPLRANNYRYSRDGKQIAFSVDADVPGLHSSSSIYVMSSAGKRVKRLTKGKFDDYDPSFSPDGKRIVFGSRRRGGHWDLYIMNSDGTRIRALTKDETQEEGPRFSPDGKQIVYSAFPNMDSWDIFVMKADGTGRKRLTRTSGTDNQEHSPSYSPDGKKIAFSASREDIEGIEIMNADGSERRRLVHALPKPRKPEL